MNDRIGTWYGRDIESLSKEELLEVIRHLGRQLREAKEDRLRFRTYSERDAARYRWLKDRINRGSKWILMRKETSGLWDQMPNYELDRIIDMQIDE